MVHQLLEGGGCPGAKVHHTLDLFIQGVKGIAVFRTNVVEMYPASLIGGSALDAKSVHYFLNASKILFVVAHAVPLDKRVAGVKSARPHSITPHVRLPVAQLKINESHTT